MGRSRLILSFFLAVLAVLLTGEYLSAKQRGQDVISQSRSAGNSGGASGGSARRTLPADVEVSDEAIRAKAESDIESGKVFRISALDKPSAKALALYRKGGPIGMKARTLAPVIAGLDERGFIGLLGKEARSGACSENRGKKMWKWQFPDGTLVRYKPHGDAYRQEPLYSIEVMHTPGAKDENSDDVAFKVDSKGRPVPKGPQDVANPFPKESAARQSYLAFIMEAGHRGFQGGGK